MSGPREPADWQRFAARLSPEMVALALTIVVVIVAWLILSPGRTGNNSAPDPSSSAAPSSASLVTTREPRIRLSVAVSWPGSA
jgi:hypothetical protein